MGYSYSQLKSLQDEQAKWVGMAEECHSLPDKVGDKLSQSSDSAAHYLKEALELLNEAGVWSGPDGDSCRSVINSLYEGAIRQRTQLKEAAVSMEQEARSRSSKIGDKIINEVLPNMSTGGKIETTLHYTWDSVAGKNK